MKLKTRSFNCIASFLSEDRWNWPVPADQRKKDFTPEEVFAINPEELKQYPSVGEVTINDVAAWLEMHGLAGWGSRRLHEMG